LVGIIAFAVVVAPVAAALVGGSRPASAATAHDCHGKAAESNRKASVADGAATAHPNHRTALQATDEDSCPDCNNKNQTKCLGDGSKCCKLTGIVLGLPAVMAPLKAVDLEAHPPALTGWQARPPPPPPRA
jgi:hypothetical protein